MEITPLSSIILILGTLLITTGFGIFPSRIYTSHDSREKLGLLSSKHRLWLLSQIVVVLGGITTIVGSIFLFLSFRESRGVLTAWIGLTGLVLGHLFWIWNLVLRIVEPQKFASGELPGWLFSSYSILVLVGLTSFGISFWLQGIYTVLGIVLLLAALLVLGLFLKFKGLPPIIYYALILGMGIWLLF